MEQTRSRTSSTLALAFLTAVVGGGVHLLATVGYQRDMNHEAIEAGYRAMDLMPTESRNGGIMITERHLFSTSATVEAYILNQSNKHKLCKYQGATYQLFGTPLFSTTKSISCTPVAPWPKLPPKP